MLLCYFDFNAKVKLKRIPEIQQCGISFEVDTAGTGGRFLSRKAGETLTFSVITWRKLLLLLPSCEILEMRRVPHKFAHLVSACLRRPIQFQEYRLN